ncbi:substrate-binding domain-containing protein [Herbiconiux sp. SYSU D00978]|uniref:substrate-binding domain-containing protein n=1 Tax=Herbiconiux sp. SYSU D00978 TaxID=2812562 RepID=UPI001A959770|nr:substrate-binding domain-containing protein [Herbiconiux sp. SYSU D00978]
MPLGCRPRRARRGSRVQSIWRWRPSRGSFYSEGPLRALNEFPRFPPPWRCLRDGFHARSTLVRRTWKKHADQPVIRPEVGAGGGLTVTHQPQLTTMRQPFGRIAAEMVAMLLDVIAGGTRESVTLPTELVVRESA